MGVTFAIIVRCSGNKCDILLPPYCVHSLCRPQQRNDAPPHRLQFSFLPALLTHRHSKRGAVARGKMMMYAAAGQCFCDLIITTMIRYNEDPALSDTTRVSYVKASIAFFFLCYVLFRHRLARCPMRLIHSACGRKALRWAPLRTGSSTSWISPIPFPPFPAPSPPVLPFVTCYILTLVRSRRNYPFRHSISAMGILDHLDRLRLHFCAHRLFLLP